jgi:hypothetical protein
MTGVLVLALATAFASPAPAADDAMTDDEFIESLGDERTNKPVDRKRLARIFFSLAATLDGGKSSVGLLHGNLIVPDTSRQAVQSLLRQRYAQYTDSIQRFKTSVSGLLDEPNSLLLLYRTLVDGQRTCWYFDLHNWFIETYGSDADMVSILSSREACGRLRTAAFQPRVEAILMDALVEQVYQRQELLELKAELRELERLLADLREIDEAD